MLAVPVAALPGTILAQQTAVPADKIISDDEFEAAIPPVPVADDPELSRPLESIEAFERRLAADRAADPATASLPDRNSPNAAASLPDGTADALTGDAPIIDAELTAPLPPLESFEVEPTTFAEAESDSTVAEVRYQVRIDGLAEAESAIDSSIIDRFHDFSALRRGKGRAANTAQISSRAGEDLALIKKLLAAEGWFDAQVMTRIDAPEASSGAPLGVVFTVVPGKRFAYSSVTVDAAPTVPPALIRDNLGLQIGEPVVAERVLAAEAKVALALPENGYPFAEVGARDILLDPDTGDAGYTLPVIIGPRGSYGAIQSRGSEAFSADHVALLARFKPGQLYDSRQVDELRQALIATGLFKGIAVEPQRGDSPGPDGTRVVDLLVTQEAGPPRVIAATAGYGTGEGLRAEASWTHRNLFPPEGALIVSGQVGTQEQGAGLVFRRSNAGRRDRTVELAAELDHSNYDAFSAYTGRLAARISYDSTPLWQKRITYAYGVQVIGTNESVYEPLLRGRTRRTYAIAGLTGQIGLDTTDSLLDPGKGFRLIALVEPEGSVQRAFSPYVRMRLDGSAYHRIGESLTLAGRVRIATLQGAEFQDIAPSRRLYAGGGGSVRGFGYQGLGNRDPEGNPTGGRSLNEAAFELRYRFGDYGVVAFADVGQSYVGTMPDFSNLRVGLGLGARIYTNFGPMRIDLATPLRRRAGESRVNVYVSIGQAF